MRRTARLRRAAGLALAALGLALGLASASFAGETLQPYQLIRSLQLVQDRIAAGDHAALPMQGKLLEMIDARLRTAPPDDFHDPRNFRALLVYGMSGGNPVTVEAATSRIELDEKNHAIADGIIDYLSGRPASAIAALEPVDPMTVPSDLGAFLALVKGSLLAAEHPAEALVLLDQARLLSPGTLVEEAALRRSVGIAVTRGDAARFALASTQYVEHYLYSPYASQFADAFVTGVIALNQAISQDKLIDITSMMDAEREKVIYLRIARRAAIDGMVELSAFASARAEQGADGDGRRREQDPRALLYASLSTVASEAIEDVRAKLGRIDRSRLSESDRALLDAAKAVVREVVAPPAPLPATKAAFTAPTPAPRPVAAEPAAGQAAETDLPVVEGAVAERPATEARKEPASGTQASEKPKPAPVEATTADAAPAEAPPKAAAAAAAVQPAAGPDAPVSSGPADPTEAAIADARRTLAAIDQLLGASPK